jgi:hypothetical protein
VGFFLLLVSLLLSLFLSLFCSRKLFQELSVKGKRKARIFTFIWYLILFPYFSSFIFVTLSYLIPQALGVPENILLHIDYKLGNLYILLPFFFFITLGLFYLFSITKKEAQIQETPISFKKALWLGTKRGILLIILTFLILVAFRLPVNLQKEKTYKQIAKIRSTKLTLDDVMGKNLPPPPDPALKDATIQGFDSNKNGIRDDVELAIFEKYPNSARIRAALLQYALALQTQMTLDVVNKETFVATIEELEEKALNCIWKLVPRDDLGKFIEETDHFENFVKEAQYNTAERKIYYKNLLEKNLGSFSGSLESCDIDPSSLPN